MPRSSVATSAPDAFSTSRVQLDSWSVVSPRFATSTTAVYQSVPVLLSHAVILSYWICASDTGAAFVSGSVSVSCCVSAAVPISGAVSTGCGSVVAQAVRHSRAAMMAMDFFMMMSPFLSK